MKKAAKDFGLVTFEEYEDLLARVTALEEAQGITHPHPEAEEHGDNHEHGESTGRKKKAKRTED